MKSIIQLTVKPKAVLVGLIALTLGLAAAHYLGMVSWFYFGHDYVRGLVPAFNMDEEGNLPAWFSSMLLFSSGVLLALIGRAQGQAKKPSAAWWVLASIFFFLSVDEFMAIHEGLGTGVGELMGASGILLEYSWVFVYGPIGLVLLALFVPFLKRLPGKCRNIMILAGALYVGGAIGIELLGSNFWIADGLRDQPWEYYALVGLEETLEMLGVSIFIFSLLTYIDISGISISASQDPKSES